VTHEIKNEFIFKLFYFTHFLEKKIVWKNKKSAKKPLPHPKFKNNGWGMEISS
jgi:hypothetical protein